MKNGRRIKGIPRLVAFPVSFTAAAFSPSHLFLKRRAELRRAVAEGFQIRHSKAFQQFVFSFGKSDFPVRIPRQRQAADVLTAKGLQCFQCLLLRFVPGPEFRDDIVIDACVKKLPEDRLLGFRIGPEHFQKLTLGDHGDLTELRFRQTHDTFYHSVCLLFAANSPIGQRQRHLLAFVLRRSASFFG